MKEIKGKKSVLVTICISILMIWNVEARQNIQTHSLKFQTPEGIFGYIDLHSKPVTMGESYTVLDAKKMVIHGVQGKKPNGYSFPLEVSKFSIDVKGDGCMKLNSMTPDCGSFSMRYLSSASSDNTVVNFSESSREKHNTIRKETGEGHWNKNGYLQNVIITVARADIFKELLSENSKSETVTKKEPEPNSSNNQEEKSEHESSEHTVNNQQPTNTKKAEAERQRKSQQAEAERRRKAQIEQERRRKAQIEQERRRKAAEERRRRAAAQQTRNELNQLSQRVLHTGGTVALSLTGDQIGMSVGGVFERGAFLFNVGTNEPAVITGEEYTVDDPVFSMGVDIGFDMIESQAFMMYVGAFMDFQTSDHIDDQFGVSSGFMGLLGGVIVYQTGVRINSDTEAINFFGSLGLQLSL